MQPEILILIMTWSVVHCVLSSFLDSHHHLVYTRVYCLATCRIKQYGDTSLVYCGTIGNLTTTENVKLIFGSYRKSCSK